MPPGFGRVPTSRWLAQVLSPRRTAYSRRRSLIPLGRGTRLRPDLYGAGQNKESFRIFDAVDLYSALEPHTAMTAVATDPKLTFARLVTELQTVSDADARSEILGQIIARHSGRAMAGFRVM